MDVESAAGDVFALCEDIWRSWTRRDLPNAQRAEIIRRADALPASGALDVVLDSALFRTVYMATYDTTVEDSLRSAAELDAVFPGAGTLFVEVSIDGSAAVGAWDDLTQYGVLEPMDVVNRTFRDRWLSVAAGRPDWPTYTATAIATLASPQCDALLYQIEPPATIVQFWLQGEELDVMHAPSPDWR